jgi:hypothetical protein
VRTRKGFAVSTDATPSSLGNTVTARWRAGLGEHWQTKTAYYDAVDRLLSAAPDAPLTCTAIVAAVQPRGSRSTFYKVTGPGARNPLIALLGASDRIDIAQLLPWYTRSSAIDQLIDETKVDRYWPYRTAWLRRYERQPDLGPEALLASLVSVVAEWARCNRAVAAALDHAPPVCAAEDLAIVGHGRISAMRAHRILVKVIRHALATPDDLADPIDPVRTDLGLVDHLGLSPEALVVGLAEQIYALAREAQRFGPMRTAPAWRAATDLMRDAIAATA